MVVVEHHITTTMPNHFQALDGKWFWYRGGMTVPGCPDWGVRWMIFETLGG